MKTILLAFLALAASAFATVKEITVTGILDHGERTDFFTGILDGTSPFTFTLQYDDQAPDLNPDPTIGEFECDGLLASFKIGETTWTSANTEIRIFAGYGEDKFWGVAWAQEEEFAEHGLNVDAYGLYASYRGAADNRGIQTDDTLQWIERLQMNPEKEASYAKISGSINGEPVRFQQTRLGDYTVMDVPEPTTSFLLLFCIVLFSLSSNHRKQIK